jgi:nicotinamide mononucleotide transporter
LPVSRWRAGRHAVAIAALLAASAVNGWIVARAQGGWVPYADAFVAWVSVLATWMVARKVLENWLYWIVVDSVAAALYWSQGFHATAVLFVAYVVIAVRGYFAWRADAGSAASAAAEGARV